MAQTYTPGLQIKESVILRKERKLPLQGEILVRPGDLVQPDTLVARTLLPGKVHPLNAAGTLSIVPDELPGAMLKNEGESVRKGELIAKSMGLFGLIKNDITSPIDGTIELISNVTGQVILREPPVPVELKAYVAGAVEEVMPHEGVVIKTCATYLQGIFGLGGEASGILTFAVAAPEEELKPAALKPGYKDTILVAGAMLTLEILTAAVKLGVKGIIAGGIADEDLKKFLGYDLGAAITGSETKNITLIITEGFGTLPMARKTFNLLKSCQGKRASINGATQIRAGVIRPEIIIPLCAEGTSPAGNTGTLEKMELKPGCQVRLIREPYFGIMARVFSLPPELQEIATGAKVRVAQVELDSGEKLLVPRSNLELI